MNRESEREVFGCAPLASQGQPEDAGRGPAQTARSLREVLLALRRGRRLILGGAAAGGLLAVAYLALATPSYTSTALLQVEDHPRTLAGLDDLAGVLLENTPADTEIEVVRSRALLGKVVDQLGLDVSARPRTFPVLGPAQSWLQGAAVPAEALPMLAWFATGGERITVSHLELPEELLGEPLRLIALGGGRYQLRDPRGGPRVEGAVGEAARNAGGDVQLLVSELRARPGTQFELRRVRRSAAIDALQLRLRVYERVKKTGMLVVELSGPSPERVAATVSAITSTYLRLTVERRSAQAVDALAFLEARLPLVKSDLDAAEARLSAYRLTRGTVDLSRETEAALARSVEIEQALSQLELQRRELRERFTESHPVLLALAQKTEQLRSERAVQTDRMRRLPATELDVARMERDVRVNAGIYELLLNKAQEFRLMRSGAVGSVRIVDPAEVPLRRTWPKPAPVGVVALLLGLVAGVGLALLRRTLREVVDDPLALARRTGLPVLAAVPYSAAEAAASRSASRRGVHWPPLALTASQDPAVESLRSLRSALPSALAGARSGVVVISSATPGAGKSFVSLNLALLLAAAESRTLLVDADLRGGRLHRRLGLGAGLGLSDLIRGTVTMAEATRRPEGSALDFIGCGTASPDPAELLAGPRMSKLLAEMAAAYEVVIVDSPPVLAVTDATALARRAGATLIVVEGGRDGLPDVDAALSRFAQAGALVRGVILNGTTALPSSYERFARYTLACVERR